MFAGDVEHNRSKSKDGDEGGFDEIEEEIINEGQEEDLYSDTFSQVSHKSKRKTNGFNSHKYPKELEENPYLYFAKKAQRRMKAQWSGKKVHKKSTLHSKNESGKSIWDGDYYKRRPTDQSDSAYGASPVEELNKKQFGVKYRPFSPPFVNMMSEKSEIEEVIDTDFVPTKNL